MSSRPGQCDELLLLYRSSGEPFGGQDLHVLASVAQRLRDAAEDRKATVAIERLAQSGHLLAAQVDADSLVNAAVELMQRLTLSDDAWIVDVVDGQAHRRAHYGSAPDTQETLADRPVTDLKAWPAATEGRVWTATEAEWFGAPAVTALCVPVLVDAEPVTTPLRNPQRTAAVRGRRDRDRHDLLPATSARRWRTLGSITSCAARPPVIPSPACPTGR